MLSRCVANWLINYNNLNIYHLLKHKDHLEEKVSQTVNVIVIGQTNWIHLGWVATNYLIIPSLLPLLTLLSLKTQAIIMVLRQGTLMVHIPYQKLRISWYSFSGSSMFQASQIWVKYLIYVTHVRHISSSYATIGHTHLLAWFLSWLLTLSVEIYKNEKPF